MKGRQVYVRDPITYWKKGTVTCEAPVNGCVTVEVCSSNNKTTRARKGVEVPPDTELSSEIRTVKLSEYRGFEIPQQNGSETLNVPNLLDLQHLNEPGVCDVLCERYLSDDNSVPLLYTRAGTTVWLAVNPFTPVPSLYSRDVQQQYADTIVWNTMRSTKDPLTLLSPHLYDVSSLCYKGLVRSFTNQSVLLSGESGSGKTESYKYLLQHLSTLQQEEISTTDTAAAITPNASNSIVDKIVYTNPILESFGNAVTVRNDNSSRFGKYTVLQYQAKDGKGAKKKAPTTPTRPATTATKSARGGGGGGDRMILVGSHTDTYLLEAARIVQHGTSERNYHVFYEILACPEKAEYIWDGLLDKTPEDYKYLIATAAPAPPAAKRKQQPKPLMNATITGIVDGKTDAQRFASLYEALQSIPGLNVPLLLKTVAAVLVLGNVPVVKSSETDDNAKLACSNTELVQVCELLGVDVSKLAFALTVRSLQANGEDYQVPLSVEGTIEARDALAKAVYSGAFDFLIETMNKNTTAAASLRDDSADSIRTIGLLDIFGFESLQTNRFGQLCINYANEKLQQKAVSDIFHKTKSEYDEEGLKLDLCEYTDNEKLLGILEGRNGVIDLLNEECFRPKGTGNALVQKVLGLKQGKKYFASVRGRTNEFEVQHYAGKVVYAADDFVTANQDRLPDDVKTLCRTTSTNLIVQRLFPVVEKPKEEEDSDDVTATMDTKDATTIDGGKVETGAKESDANTTDANNRFAKGGTFGTKKESSPFRISSSTSSNGGSGAAPSWMKKGNSLASNESSINSKNEPMGGSIKPSKSFDSEATRLTGFRAGGTRPESNSRAVSNGRAPQRTASTVSTESRGGDGGAAVKRSKSKDVMGETVWTKYQDQLTDLLDMLGETQCRYVRCIKPNDKKVPGLIEQGKAIEQLRCAGIVATVKLSRAIYPSSMPNAILRYRFGELWDKQKFPSAAKSFQKASIRCRHECKALLSCALAECDAIDNVKQDPKYVVGKSKSYFGAGLLEYLEAQRVLRLDHVAIVLQRQLRGMRGRGIARKLKDAADIIRQQEQAVLDEQEAKEQVLAAKAQALLDEQAAKAQALADEQAAKEQNESPAKEASVPEEKSVETKDEVNSTNCADVETKTRDCLVGNNISSASLNEIVGRGSDTKGKSLEEEVKAMSKPRDDADGKSIIDQNASCATTVTDDSSNLSIADEKDTRVAATSIQCCWRRLCARQYAMGLKMTRNFVGALLKIQSPKHRRIVMNSLRMYEEDGYRLSNLLARNDAPQK